MTQWRFADGLPAGGGWYAHYEYADLRVAGWNRCDVRSLVRLHQEVWLDAYDAWHAEVCQQASRLSRWWWLMPASRPNIWVQQGTLKPLVFAAALSEWAAAHPACRPIHVVGAPATVRRYLEEFGRGEAPRGGFLPRLRRWRALARVLKECWTVLMRCLASAARRPVGSAARANIVCYSHVVQARALEEGGDHFFGDMLEAAESAFPGDVLTAYLLHDEAERNQVERLLVRSGRRFTFLFDHLTRWDACWAAWCGLSTCLSVSRALRNAPPIRLGRWVSRSFPRSYVAEHVFSQPSVMEFAVYRAMKRLIARSGLRVLVYPYEEKALERAILQARAEGSTPIRTLAYAHAAHSTCHLALRTRREPAANPPSPDRLLATGPQASAFLTQWARKAAESVASVGSPRHLPSIEGPRSMSARQESLRLLVLTGFGYELGTLATFVEQRPDLLRGCETRIRRYQFAWQAEQDRGIQRLLRVSAGRIEVSSATLIDLFKWCDVALFSSTSAGIQAMLAGRLVIYADLQDLFEADPCWGTPACFARCTTADGLAQALDRARSLTDVEYTQQVCAQRAFATSIFAPFDRARFIAEMANETHMPALAETRAERTPQPIEMGGLIR